MLKNLSIQNFRGFRNFDAELAPVTAFLGPNSSGKTTALHAIRLACDLLGRAVDSDRPARVTTYEGEKWIDVTSDTLLGDPSVLLALADWRALFVDQEVGERVAFSIDLQFEENDHVQELIVRVSCARNQQLKLDVSIRAAEAVARVEGLPRKSPLINQQLTEFLREHAPRAVFIPPFYGTTPSEELRTRAVIDRLLGSGDQSHVVRNMVASLGSDRFRKMNEFLSETVGARLTYRTSGDALQAEPSLRVNFRDTNGDIELSAAGAGFINLVALYAALSRWREETQPRQVIFLLDEPEAHLHPRLQADSASGLARLVTQDFQKQLILATHSLDILNRLSQEGARLLRCDRNATPSVQALDSDASLFDDLAGWVDLTPYTAINFLASRKVLFVEGPDELALLPRLAAVRYGNDLAALQRFQRWALVALDGASKAPIASLLERLVRNDVVRARAQQGGFDIVVVLDRDFEREPGTTTSTEANVTQTRVVWPVHSLESLLVTAPVLTRWVRAFLGQSSPPDLEARVLAAIAAADTDPELNSHAISHLTAARIETKLRQGVSLTADHSRVLKEASEEAQNLVHSAPAAWQRGKNRAEAILSAIRIGLEGPAQAHFPVDICRLVARTDLNQIGDSVSAIPAELNDLLGLLASQPAKRVPAPPPPPPPPRARTA